MHEQKKMLLSTRRDPPKHLTLPPQSSSQHLSIKQFLLNSPLPSPALPSILPRHGKKPPRLNTRKFLRYLCWLGILTTIFVIFKQPSHTKHRLGNYVYESSNGQRYEIVGTSSLPDFASPVALKDKNGRSKWTVSIPAGLRHPLASTEYADICTYAADVSSHVAASKHGSGQSTIYKTRDPNFIDPMDASETSLLPHSSVRLEPHSDLPSCKKSLTYVLDAAEAGLGQTLLGLWMSYSLAKRENRAFIIDDRNFPFGNFSNLFSTALATPNCQLPPWEYRTPCPRQAKHLIVNAATLPFVFGESFNEKHDTKEVYKMARDGYEALFQLRSDDSKYVSDRIKELRSSLNDEPESEGALIGIHIRRGDRHPYEFQYQHGYIPPSKYLTVAQDFAKVATGGRTDSKSVIMLASDDADLYHDPEVNGTVRAQEQIRLASKKQLAEGSLGWEGGFFSDAFWGVGLPEHAKKRKSAGSPSPSKVKDSPSSPMHQVSLLDEGRDYRTNPTPEARQLREYIGRAYLLDLSMLAHSDAVVCGVSSYGCRVLGVMMGWDKVRRGGWKNIDGEYGWRGLF